MSSDVPPPDAPPPPAPDLASETLRGLYGAWLLLLGRREAALSMFNLSEGGFWRSFMAFAVALPVYLLAVRLGVPAAADTAARKAVLGAVLFRGAITLALQWVLWLIAAAALSRPLGLAAHYGRYVIVYNWSTPLVLAFQIVPVVLYFFGYIGRDAAGFLFLFLLGVVLYLRWWNARVGLEAPPFVAVGLVLADVLLSLLVLRVLGEGG